MGCNCTKNNPTGNAVPVKNSEPTTGDSVMIKENSSSHRYQGGLYDGDNVLTTNQFTVVEEHFGDTEDLFKEFNVIWFDPKVDNLMNKLNKEKLTDLFHKAIFISDPSKIKDEIENSSRPVIAISAGETFDLIKEFVDNDSFVVAVLIIASDIEEFKLYKEKSKKIIDIIANFNDLKIPLKDILTEFELFQRIFDGEEFTFLEMSDRSRVMTSLSKAYKGRAITILYPLGTKEVRFSDYLTSEEIAKISKAAEANSKVNDQLKQIQRSLNFIVTNSSPEGIIVSYVRGKLYYMLNKFLRSGHKRNIRIFKKYLFCLRASLCEKGNPIIKKGTKLYRGLSEDLVTDFVNRKGDIVLMNGFSSTSSFMENALKFVKRIPSTTPCLLEITMVDSDDCYSNFIKEFGFIDENSIFFPSDISEFTNSKQGEEIVFPAFYPMKIIEGRVETINGLTHKIISVQAPLSVSIYANDIDYDYFDDILEDTKWKEPYADSLFELIKKKVVNRLTLSKFDLAHNKFVQEALFNVLSQETMLNRISIEYESFKKNPSLLQKIMEIKGLQYLSLKGCNINSEGEKIIRESLKNQKSLIDLNLSFVPLGDESAKEIADLVGESTTLSRLSMKTIDLTSQGAEIIAAGIKNNKSLAFLDLDENCIGYVGIYFIADAVKSSTKLETLWLSGCDLKDKGTSCVARCLNENKSILEVNLHGNSISNEGALHISHALKANTTLLELYLGGNKINNEGISLIAISLTQNKTLELLDLGNNQMGYDGAIKIAKMLKVNSALKVLNIESNNIGEKGATHIALGIKENRSVTELYLKNNNINLNAARALAESIVENQTLIKLHLADNSIGEKGAGSFGTYIKANGLLEELDLTKNEIEEKGATEIAAGLKSNKKLKKLFMGENNIGDKGGLAIGESLIENRSLTQLELNNNNIGVGCNRVFYETLKVNQVITSINLKGNLIRMGEQEQHTLFKTRKIALELNID